MREDDGRWNRPTNPQALQTVGIALSPADQHRLSEIARAWSRSVSWTGRKLITDGLDAIEGTGQESGR